MVGVSSARFQRKFRFELKRDDGLTALMEISL